VKDLLDCLRAQQITGMVIIKTPLLPTMKLAIFFALLLVTTASAFVPPSSTKTITTTTVLLSTKEDDVHAVSALDSRRTVLLSSATIAGAVCGTLVASPPTLSTIANAAVTSPLVDADYTAVAKDIAAIIKKDSNKGPTLVRLVSLRFVNC